jgi:hypothetical protein
MPGALIQNLAYSRSFLLDRRDEFAHGKFISHNRFKVKRSAKPSSPTPFFQREKVEGRTARGKSHA